MTRRDEGHGKKNPSLPIPVGSSHARPPGPQETLSHAGTRTPRDRERSRDYGFMNIREGK